MVVLTVETFHFFLVLFPFFVVMAVVKTSVAVLGVIFIHVVVKNQPEIRAPAIV